MLFDRLWLDARLATFDPALPPEPAAVQRQLEGVTQSADWGFDDPADFSAPA